MTIISNHIQLASRYILFLTVPLLAMTSGVLWTDVYKSLMKSILPYMFSDVSRRMMMIYVTICFDCLKMSLHLYLLFHGEKQDFGLL